MKDDFSVILITAPTAEEGKKLAKGLVQEKLAACVNVVTQVESFYWWEGKIEHANEVLLVVKTLAEKESQIETWVRTHHSYSVPEVIRLSIIEGSQPYLTWLKESLQ